MRKIANAALFVVLFGAGAIALYDQNWSNAFVITVAILLGALPYFLRKKYGIKLSRKLNFGILLFLFSTILLGEVNYFYEKFAWWDMVLHVVAGLGLTVFGFIILNSIYSQSELRSTPGMTAFFAFGFTGMVAVVWEIFEFAVDTLIESSNMQPSNTDTMQDLIVTLAAALVVTYFGYRHLKYREKNLTGEMIDESDVSTD
jgi:hypothetical protein